MIFYHTSLGSPPHSPHPQVWSFSWQPKNTVMFFLVIFKPFQAIFTLFRPYGGKKDRTWWMMTMEGVRTRGSKYSPQMQRWGSDSCNVKWHWSSWSLMGHESWAGNNSLDRIVRGLYIWIVNFGNSIGQLCPLSSHQLPSEENLSHKAFRAQWGLEHLVRAERLKLRF